MSDLAMIQPSAVLSVIERAAIDPNIDIEKMERLLSMHERLVSVDAKKAYATAMSEAQSRMRTVGVDASNPQTRSRYASYAKLDHALRPIYTENGFALSFNSSPDIREDWVTVVCMVSHKGGHTENFTLPMPADGKGAKGGDVMTKTHATGSAMSYGMRYLLKMIFNVAVGEEDDDGNSAGYECISANDSAELKALIEATNTDVKRFLIAFGSPPSVDQMRADSFPQAKVLLLKKKEKMESTK